jgi:hypothetical protein
MRCFVSFAITAMFALSATGARAQYCEQQVESGVPDPTFNALFTQDGPGTGNEPAGSAGWTGADSTYSRALPDGRVLFFFSDSFLASSPVPNGATVVPDTRMRTNPIFQGHNSIVALNTDGSLTTTYGGDALNPTSLFVPTNSNDLYWMGDSVLVQTSPSVYQLYLFLLEFNSSTFAYVGSSLATLSLPNLSVQSVQPLTIEGGVEWGSAILQQGQTLYVYGMEDLGAGKYPHVGKLAVRNLANPSAWQFWNGGAWVSGATNSARIIGAPDSISNEYSVNQIHADKGNSFVLTTMDTSVPFGTWQNIVLYFSCSPQGPWSPKQVVYATPETGQKDQPGLGTLLTYNPHAHFEFTSNGAVLISYDLNTTQGDDLTYADNYRPKFIRVPMAGLKP